MPCDPPPVGELLPTSFRSRAELFWPIYVDFIAK